MLEPVFSEKFINELENDPAFRNHRNDIIGSGERFVNYTPFIDDEDGIIERELFIQRLEYYESYVTFNFYYDDESYTIVMYYGYD